MLDELTLRVGRGMVIDTGGGLVGELEPVAVELGMAMSEISDPSRSIFGSGCDS